MIDLKRLQFVKRRGGNIIARCPACWEQGGDRKGEHLIVFPNGRFACCCNPGPRGDEHRQRIYALVCATSPVPPPAPVFADLRSIATPSSPGT